MGCAECVFQKLYAEFSRLVDYVQNGLSKINIYIYIVFGLIYICICRVYLELLMRDNIYLNIPPCQGGIPSDMQTPHSPNILGATWDWHLLPKSTYNSML